jgi:hypothetical protein
MLVINRLTEPSQIKVIVLRKDGITVTMHDKQKILFRRVEETNGNEVRIQRQG